MANTSEAQNDVLASMVLLGATAAALIFVNSPLSSLYKDFITLPVSVRVGDFAIDDPLKNWIKNALMAVFFLLVGLELKSEFKEGLLSDRKSAILPFIGAFAGMAAPALVYLWITGADPALISGWAIPCATDIAFAVGIIGLLGNRVPPGLKALLLAVAVIDDLGAILVIAFFYTAGVNMTAIALAATCIAVLAWLNFQGNKRVWIYILGGVALWLCLMKSGVNATLAGVVVALFIPLRSGDDSPLHDLADAIKWPVVFLIMPLFAFANAGVPLGTIGLSGLADPLTLGISMGLFIGKIVGISLAIYIAVKTGLSVLPYGVNWGQIVGMSAIAGIGFTMSLFIGALAFQDEALIDQAKLGTLSGSVLAALTGVILLVASAPKEHAPDWALQIREAFKRKVW